MYHLKGLFDRNIVHRAYRVPMERWPVGNQSTTTFKMGPELRFTFISPLIVLDPSKLPFLTGCLSQVLPQSRPKSDEGELWGCCVPCQCYQVCIPHQSYHSVVSIDIQKWNLIYVYRYFVCRALQFPPEAWLRISLKHASITWITIRLNNQKMAQVKDC